MSAKEVGLIVIIAFITIGGFIFLAPEYKKNAELKETLAQNQLMIDNLRSDIEHKRKIVNKLDANDSATTSRILRERFGYCTPEENVFQFKNSGKETKNAE